MRPCACQPTRGLALLKEGRWASRGAGGRAGGGGGLCRLRRRTRWRLRRRHTRSASGRAHRAPRQCGAGVEGWIQGHRQDAPAGCAQDTSTLTVSYWGGGGSGRRKKSGGKNPPAACALHSSARARAPPSVLSARARSCPHARAPILPRPRARTRGSLPIDFPCNVKNHGAWSRCRAPGRASFFFIFPLDAPRICSFFFFNLLYPCPPARARTPTPHTRRPPSPLLTFPTLFRPSRPPPRRPAPSPSPRAFMSRSPLSTPRPPPSPPPCPSPTTPTSPCAPWPCKPWRGPALSPARPARAG